MIFDALQSHWPSGPNCMLCVILFVHATEAINIKTSSGGIGDVLLAEASVVRRRRPAAREKSAAARKVKQLLAGESSL